MFVAVFKNVFPSLDADQQRREKLRKELARCEKEFKLSKSAMQTNSKMNSKFFVNSLQRVRFFCSLKAGVCEANPCLAWVGQVWVSKLWSSIVKGFFCVPFRPSPLSQLPANREQPLQTPWK